MNDINAVLPDVKLRFNMEHPCYEECYAHGYETALAGFAEEENPYRVDTAEHDQWAEGWWAGFYGDEPLFKEALISERDEADIAANDHLFHGISANLITKWMKITSAIAVSAIVGYQILDLVA